MENLEILETCLYADDLEAAEQFYMDVLGLELLSRKHGRHVFFRLPGSMLLIFSPEAASQTGDLPGHGAQGAVHCCLKINESSFEDWKAHLQAHGVEILAEQNWPRGGKSLYFHDPAGNVLELAPAGIWGLD